jgi:hypothetical protein
VLSSRRASGYVDAMNHPARIEKPRADMSPEELDAWLEALPPLAGVPSTDEEVAAADARALADLEAGRVYPHAIVGEWLKTWGKPGRKPFKEWLADRHG